MNIFDLFDKAAKSLQYPKITYPLDDKHKIQFSMAGPTAKYPGTINITDGKSFHSGYFYGRIFKDTEAKKLRFMWLNEPLPHHKEIIRAVVANPVGMCSITGQKMSYCCFCGTEITTKESLAVGYGPICAEKWGLPWGQLPLDVGNL